MTAGPWTPTNATLTKILNGTFDWDSDTFKVALLLSTSNISTSSTAFSGVSNEHSNGNGYTTGGETVAFTLTGTTSVTVHFTSNPEWEADGGDIVARYACIYEDGGDVAFFMELDDSPADVTVTDGNLLVLRNSTGDASPVFTLSVAS